MSEFYTVITTAGREAVAKATQAGEKVNITHMAVGDGGGVPVTPDENQTQLVNECWRGVVTTYKQQGTSLIIDSYIPPDETSFTAREMGLFTADGVLFAVCNTPEMRKVLPSEGAVGSFVFGMELDVTNIDMRYIEIQTNPELDFIPTSEKGQPNGVAELDEYGNLKQLPELNFDPAGSAQAVQVNLNAHINNKQNPHAVTAAQVGAYTKAETNNLINTHINNKQNPHGVTAAQVGAYTKAQSLTSATAQLFGLSASAVPNEVLSKIKTLMDTSNSVMNQKIGMISGTYIGDGAASRTIQLGVYPTAVFVLYSGLFLGDGNDPTGGLALRNSPINASYGSKSTTALLVNQVGFNVYFYSGDQLYSMTNINGQKYHYIAFY